MKPILFAILAALFWGISPMFEKIGLKDIDPFIAVVIRNIVATICIIALLGVSGRAHELLVLNKKAIFFIAVGGILASFLGQLVYYTALKYGDVSEIVPVSSIYPLFAVFIGLLILKEDFNIEKLIGTILIIIGVLLIR